MKIDSHARSVLKSISWRLISVVATFCIVYYFTRDARISLSIGVVDLIIKLTLFYFHERAWTHIKWGRQRKKDIASSD